MYLLLCVCVCSDVCTTLRKKVVRLKEYSCGVLGMCPIESNNPLEGSYARPAAETQICHLTCDASPVLAGPPVWDPTQLGRKRTNYIIPYPPGSSVWHATAATAFGAHTVMGVHDRSKRSPGD